jgi:hypothetical protein
MHKRETADSYFMGQLYAGTYKGGELKMEPAIFISYRRDDEPGLTAQIHTQLSEHFSPDALFLDIDSIEAGTDFATEILRALQSCDVMLVIIGPKWLELSDESGGRRLDDPMDYLRMEVESSLHHLKPIIPVIVYPAKPPKENELPDSIKRLARWQGLTFRPQHFNDDMMHLIKRINEILHEAEEQRGMKSRPPSVVDYFEVVLPTMLRWRGGRASQLAADANCSIAFDVQGEGGGTWVLVLKPPKPYVHSGPMDDFDCTLKLTVERMQEILSGQFDARKAIASGELEILGDVSLLKVVAPLF